MSNRKQCAESESFMSRMLSDVASIGCEAAPYVDWEGWLESDEREPKFKGARPARYSPTSKLTRWYKCLVLDDARTIGGKPAALIWTLAAEHVAILVGKENIRYA